MEMNKELLAKAKEMKTPEELMALAKENGIAAATAAVIAPRSDITAALLQKKKSRD